MVSLILYSGLIAFVSIERLYELGLSRRNERTQLAAGGIEYGARHYPVMVVLHVVLLGGCLVESWFLDRSFVPLLGYPMLALVVGAGLGRLWIIATLGDRWTTRVMVVPGLKRIRTGPYRFLDHPNYMIVILEGIALPMVHSNWITACAFTLANGVLLTVRIRAENKALAETYRDV